jgi:hypothetical protein
LEKTDEHASHHALETGVCPWFTMSQYHPDKLTGQGLPDDMIALATEKTKEIQLAYDLIQKTRAG